MSKHPLAHGPVQLAYAVADVEQAAVRWVSLGAGPFFVRHHIPVHNVVVEGSSGSFDHSSAYGQWGSVMVELVTVHHPPHLAGWGLHHVAYLVDSFDQATNQLTRHGWPQSLVATAGTTRFAFHDAHPSLGHFIEIYERSGVVCDFYAMVAAAAKGWHGHDPIRLLGRDQGSDST